MFFFSSRRRHTRCLSDWSSDVCSSDLARPPHRLLPEPPAPSTVPPPPPPAPQNLETRIRLAVDSVAHKAWAAVAGVRPPEEQFRQAKQKVLQLVARLSP